MAPESREQQIAQKSELAKEAMIFGLATIAVPVSITYVVAKNSKEAIRDLSLDFKTAYGGSIDHDRTFGGSASGVSFREKTINEAAMLAQHITGALKAGRSNRRY